MTDPTGEQAIRDALTPFGWTCGPEFWDRYYSDTWVFHLANAVERQARALDRLSERGEDWKSIAHGYRTLKPENEELRRELEELRSLIPVLVERVQRGGPSNLVDIADKYMTAAQAALLRALVAPSVPETPEETKQ